MDAERCPGCTLPRTSAAMSQDTLIRTNPFFTDVANIVLNQAATIAAREAERDALKAEVSP